MLGDPPPLLKLPIEILQHIFSYIYPPWHLQIKLRASLEIEHYFDQPDLRADPACPPVAPLLVCTSLREVVQPLMQASFTGTVNAFEKTGFKMLPEPWTCFTPRVTRLCVPNHIAVWLWDTLFINSLPALEVVEFFEDFGTLRCNLGRYPFVGLLEEYRQIDGDDSEDSGREARVLKQLLMDDKFDEYWAFRAEPYIPSRQPPANPRGKHWLGNFMARNIRVVVHAVFTFHLPDPTLIPVAPDFASNSRVDSLNWSKYRSGDGVIEELDVALVGCKEELNVVRKRWICSLRAEDRIL